MNIEEREKLLYEGGQRILSKRKLLREKQIESIKQKFDKKTDLIHKKYVNKWNKTTKRIKDLTTIKEKAKTAKMELSQAKKQAKKTGILRKKPIKELEKAKNQLARYEKSKIQAKAKAKDKTIKTLAYDVFQLYIRISKSDHHGYVTLMDTQAKVKYNECVAGHLRGKQRNPHLGFIEDNVRPITAGTNQRQAENFGDAWCDNVIKAIGIMRYQELCDLQKDKQQKNTLRDSNYYRKQYEYYKSKAIIEFMKRGLPLHPLLGKE